MKSSLRLGLTGLAMLTLSACAGPGALTRISADLGDGRLATIYAHDQQVPSWMLATDQLALNYIVKGEQTESQLAAIAGAEKSCRLYTRTSRPNELVAVVSNGTLYAIAGFVGVGLGSQAFVGTSFKEYGEYGAGASGFSGAANGVVQIGGKVYTFQNCGRELFELFDIQDVRILQTSPY